MATGSASTEKSEPTAAASPAGQARRSRRFVWLAVTAVVVVAGGASVWAAIVWRGDRESPETIERLLFRQEWERGEKLARRLVERDPTDPAAILLLARALGGRKEFVQCAELLETVPAEAAERAESLLRAGQAWMMAYDRRKAERAWRACLELSSDDLALPAHQQECRHLLCDSYFLERRSDVFEHMTWQLHEHALPQDRHKALAMRVRFQFVITAPTRALSHLQPAADRDPKDVFSRRAIGLYQIEAGQPQAARASLVRTVQDAPDQPLIWETWLDCLDRTGDQFGLEQAVQKLPQAADDSALCWKFRAIVAANKRDLDAAIAACRRAIELDPFDPELHHRAAQFLVQARRQDEAQQHVTRNQELQEARESLRSAMEAYDREWRVESARRAELACALGQASERLGRVRDAAGWYRAGLSEDPAHAQCIAALEKLRPALPPESPIRP